MTADDKVGLADLVHGLVEQHKNERGPLLPVLHGVQHALGCVPSDAIPLIATGLNLSRADVYGVVTFYRDFTTEPAARTIRVCRAEACQAVGAEALAKHARARLGAGFGEIAPAGDGPGDGVRIDEVFCLGNCALGPSVEADGTVYGRVGPGELDAIIAGSK